MPEKKSGKTAEKSASKETKNVTPKVQAPTGPCIRVKKYVVKSPDGTKDVVDKAYLRAYNAGRAGRIFLLDKEGNFVRVIKSDEFVAIWSDKNIGHSKRPVKEGKVAQSLDTAATVPGDKWEHIAHEAHVQFKAIYGLVQSGALKGSKGKGAGRKVEIEDLNL